MINVPIPLINKTNNLERPSRKKIADDGSIFALEITPLSTPIKIESGINANKTPDQWEAFLWITGARKAPIKQLINTFAITYKPYERHLKTKERLEYFTHIKPRENRNILISQTSDLIKSKNNTNQFIFLGCQNAYKQLNS